MLRIRALGPTAVMLLGTSIALASDGYFPVGYGIKSQGMGGVGVALPQDGLAAATNPAGMALVPDRADIGLTWLSPNRSTQIVDNGFAGVNGTYDGNGHRNSVIPEFGYLKKIDQTTTVGVAVYSHGSMDTQYDLNVNYGAHVNDNIPYSFLGANNDAGIKLEQWFVSPSVAYKPNEQHALGLALNFAYQRFSAHGLGAVLTTGSSEPSSNPRDVIQSGTDTSIGWGIRLGWTGQVTPELTLGASWASKINNRKFKNESGLFENGGSFDIPENYGVGLAYKVAPGWTFSTDISRIKYGSVNQVANPISIIALGNYPLGSTIGPGFGWNNVTVVKLGVSYDVAPSVTLRAGYNHAGQVIPNGRTYFNILAPATVHKHLTVGGTWKTSTGGELSAAYVHGFKNTLKGVNSIPASYPFYGGGNADISTEENTLGIAYGWKF